MATDDALPGGGGVYEYVDEQSRTYQFADGAVITPQRGDVCAIPYDPGDGRWSKSKAKPTRLPDNHPDQIAKTQAAAAMAREQALRPQPLAESVAPANAESADTGKAAS